MSWSAYASSVMRKEVEFKVEASFNSAYPNPSAEVKEQFERAMSSLALLLPVVQPEQDGLVNVSLNGHANKDHRKDPNWANDMLTINVTQV